MNLTAGRAAGRAGSLENRLCNGDRGFPVQNTRWPGPAHSTVRGAASTARGAVAPLPPLGFTSDASQAVGTCQR